MFYSPFENATNELNKIKQSFEQEKLFFNENIACPNCKTQLADFLETGYVGCTECYKIFSSDINAAIYDFHKATRHVGKRPDRAMSKVRINKEIANLLKEQAKASAEEDFILAQSIKEKIEMLRRSL